MKILLIINYLLSINLNINLILIINYFYLNIYITPLKQLIHLISYILLITINILILKQSISLNLFILLIIFVRGILIIFSYFISLINNLSKKNNYFNLFILNSIILIIILISINQTKIFIKNLNFNYLKNNKINNVKKLYLKPNYCILIIFIIFLILILLIITKICYIKNKNLRAKKWKK